MRLFVSFLINYTMYLTIIFIIIVELILVNICRIQSYDDKKFQFLLKHSSVMYLLGWSLFGLAYLFPPFYVFTKITYEHNFYLFMFVIPLSNFITYVLLEIITKKILKNADETTDNYNIIYNKDIVRLITILYLFNYILN